ncbi:MAG: putative metal-binding motif-containing protein [Myxococcota bacterium]|nr:putative metal-binding motif-containing protein [Myxococcota bacterium]
MALERKSRWPWSLGLGAFLCVGCLDKLTPLEVQFDTGRDAPVDTALPDTGPGEDTSAPDRDADGDGFPASQDCDDDNPAVFPGAVEACDGIDNDCDALVDDEDDSLDSTTTPVWYNDSDGDGFGSSDASLQVCVPPTGWVADGSDCDDSDSLVFPGAVELCNGVDDDCDSEVDEGLPDVDGSGTADCKEVAVVVSAGFFIHAEEGQCDGVSYLERELQEIKSFLNDLGLSLVAFSDRGNAPLAYSEISPYPVVVYHNGGWAEAGTGEFMNALESASAAGQGLFFLGDDLANHASLVEANSGHVTLFKLAGLDNYSANVSVPEVVVAEANHPVMDGDYGAVGAFEYVADIDEVSAAGLGEVVLMETSLGPVALASELETGQRTLSMMASLHNSHDCPIADADGRTQLERFFKNGLEWLMDW